ncbi:unnamed protein product [Rotaria sordida]|uniref:Uncharacterized protein n=1 Tax=Rotaria sordida TaxID=392033 RepID=A0A815UX70_9BILA|nr:unnamed protein product [Rotaria sordida]CAF1549299.1 unnamed protein product [Rotaria sordida]CAF4060207.1 unnamed protein product [Rotaria sordida]CAF4100774.1 unnamed protein product [Rotaria sordida]
MMFRCITCNPNIIIPYGYAQTNPIIPSPIYQISKRKSAGGNTLVIIVSAFAAAVLIGMTLGLGLGIGAAGLITNENLISTINSTINTDITISTNSTG